MALQRVLLISGPIHAGKSRLANELQTAYGFARISSRGYLATRLPPGLDADSEHAREELQETGDRLDRETDYRWIVDPVAADQIKAAPQIENWLVDAVRKPRQVEHFRAALPGVRHVHLTAPEHVLIARHEGSPDHYAQTIAHPNEISARSLGAVADLILNTNLYTPAAMAERVMGLWES